MAPLPNRASRISQLLDELADTTPPDMLLTDVPSTPEPPPPRQSVQQVRIGRMYDATSPKVH